MEDILTNLPVYDKNEQVAWLDSASRAHQAEIHGKERASHGNYQEVERSGVMKSGLWALGSGRGKELK